MGISMKIPSFTVACGLTFVLFGLYAGTPTLANKGDSTMGPKIYGKQESQHQISYTQTGGGTYNPQIQRVDKIETKGNFHMGSSDKQGDTSAGTPTLANKGDSTMGPEIHGEQESQHQISYTQTGGGTYNPQIQSVDKIETKGNFHMGSSDKQGDTSFVAVEKRYGAIVVFLQRAGTPTQANKGNFKHGIQ